MSFLPFMRVSYKSSLSLSIATMLLPRLHALAPRVKTSVSRAPPLASFAQQQVGHSGHLSADELRNQHDPPAVDGRCGLTDKQKYLFDLNGFLVLRNVFR